jgi:tetratricopeptide (TPR) repeat protein
MRYFSIDLNLKIAGVVVMAAALWANGSAAWAQPASALPETSQTNIQNSKLDSELFYELFVAEASAQSGDGAGAFALFLDAAGKTGSAQLYERAVRMAFIARNGDAALQAAQAWVRAQPASVDALRYLVDVLVNLNRAQETVVPVLRGLRQMQMHDKRAAVEMLPRYFERISDRDLAVRVIEQILLPETHDSKMANLAWATMGRMRLRAGDLGGALSAVRYAGAIEPVSVETALLALSILTVSQENLEPIIQRYLDGTPHAEFRVAYIRYLMGAQRDADAGVQMQRLTEEKPDFAEAWLLRGTLDFQHKKYAEAEAALLRYLALQTPSLDASEEPADMERPMISALLSLSQIAEKSGRLEDAMGYLQRIRSQGEAIRFGALQAILLARHGKLPAALELIRQLPEHQPDARRQKINAEVMLLQELQKPQAAYQTMEAAVQKFPHDVDLKYDLAMMAEKAGQLAVMEKLIRQIIAIQPDYHAAYNALGYSLADRNVRLPEARQLVQKALELVPNDPFIVDSLAWVEYRSGNAAEAARLLQGAFQERPDAEIAAHLGEVLWALGRRDDAKTVWKEGLRLNSDNATLLETLQRLNAPP